MRSNKRPAAIFGLAFLLTSCLFSNIARDGRKIYEKYKNNEISFWRNVCHRNYTVCRLSDGTRSSPDIYTAKVTVTAPTAANVSVGGQVFASGGGGLANAMVYLTDPSGNTLSRRTNTFGYYRFDDLAAGQTVVVTVVSKRFQFTPQVVSVAESISDLNFYAPPQ